MYSRPTDRKNEVIIPHNYSGSIFRGRHTPNISPAEPHAEPHADPHADPRSAQIRSNNDSDIGCTRDVSTDSLNTTDSVSAAATSIFSPQGLLGTEEILLIAIALIIFQSGKEPYLALMLLALLFIN